MNVKPYDDNGTKKEQVRTMFDRIAVRYDFLNRILSLGIDKKWRKKTIKMVAAQKPADILDLATGTGDMAIAMTEKIPYANIYGLDLSNEMLAVARKRATEKGIADRIVFTQGDGESIGYEDDTFDAVTISFGIRNFEDIPQGLREIYRVLKAGGRCYILEFSMPRNKLVNAVYTIYFRKFLPWVGGLVSGDRKAYKYLNESVENFPYREQFMEIMRDSGFKENKMLILTFGLVTIYSVTKI